GFGRARGPEEGSVGRPTIGASARATADSGASAFSAVSNKLSEGAGNVVPALFANCVVGLGHAVASIGSLTQLNGSPLSSTLPSGVLESGDGVFSKPSASVKTKVGSFVCSATR